MTLVQVILCQGGHSFVKIASWLFVFFNFIVLLIRFVFFFSDKDVGLLFRRLNSVLVAPVLC